MNKTSSETEPSFGEKVMVRLVAAQQFNSRQIIRCLQSARLLGNAGLFAHRWTWCYDRQKPLHEKLDPSSEINLGNSSLSSVGITEFQRLHNPPATLTFFFAPQPKYIRWQPPLLTYTVPESYLKGKDSQETTEVLVKIFREWASETHSFFGNIHLWSDWTTIRPKKSRPLGETIPVLDFLESISWANYFGPELVRELGYERLIAAPVWRAEPTDKGGIVLVLSKSPLNPDNPENRDIQRRVVRYLGLA